MKIENENNTNNGYETSEEEKAIGKAVAEHLLIEQEVETKIKEIRDELRYAKNKRQRNPISLN